MLNQTGLFIIRLKTAQAVAMMHQKVQQQLGIAGIVLGSGRNQRSAKLRGSARVNRVDVQLFVFAEHEHQSAARLLHCQRNGLIDEASAQHCRPRRNRFRTMLDLAAPPPPATAAGLCPISPRSRRSESAGCNDQACFLSPQSMATKAAKRGSSLPSRFILHLLFRAGALFPRKAYSRVLVVPDGI